MRSVLVAASASLALCSLPVFADNERPSVVENVRAEGATGPAVSLSWDKPNDNVGVEGFNVYRDGNYYTTVLNTTSYTDSGVSGNREYRYRIVAFDQARNYSTLSASASAQSGGVRAVSNSPAPSPQQSQANSNGNPAPPSGLQAAENGSSATISWNAPSGGADGYNVYKNGNYHATVKGGTSYSANGLTGTSEFEIVAFLNDRYSVKSETLSVSTNGDDQASPPPATNQSPPPNANPSPPPTGGGKSAVPNGYNLVFSDEFDRGNIDSGKWNTSYRWGANWIINNEEQYYVDILRDPNFGISPFKLNGNHLTIEATQTPDGLRDKAAGQKYLSGAMTTHNKFKMKFGYVEMRAKLPKGKGLWPAFWLLHESNDINRPEIDVVEMLGQDPNLVYQTYHYYENWNLRSTPSFKAPGPDYSQDFHTFGMLWEPGRITWYVDGVETNRHENGNVANEEMYLLVNLALGGGWAGSPDGSTPFPARMEIDYIRAYK